MKKVETKMMYTVGSTCFDNYNEAVGYAERYNGSSKDVKIEKCEIYKKSFLKKLFG